MAAPCTRARPGGRDEQGRPRRPRSVRTYAAAHGGRTPARRAHAHHRGAEGERMDRARPPHPQPPAPGRDPSRPPHPARAGSEGACQRRGHDTVRAEGRAARIGARLRLAAPPPAARDAGPHPEGQPAGGPRRGVPLRGAGPGGEREIPGGGSPAASRHRHRGEPDDSHATSTADARGLYQIWPSTGRLLLRGLGRDYDDSVLYDPERNTEAAALYLDILFAAYGDPQMVLAEYNGGPLNAGYFRAGVGQLATETRNYVPQVLDVHARLKERFEKGNLVQLETMHRDARREGKTLAGPISAGTAAARKAQQAIERPEPPPEVGPPRKR